MCMCVCVYVISARAGIGPTGKTDTNIQVQLCDRLASPGIRRPLSSRTPRTSRPCGIGGRKGGL